MALPNLSQIQQALDEMLPKLKPIDLPTGAYGYFHSVPDGWLECNGAAISRTTYADLFKVIGTKYGAGDGSTTFNLPDMNGRVLQATTNHSEVGQMKEASLPNITGKLSNPWAVMKGSAKALGSGAIVTTHNENSDWCGYSNANGVSTSTFEIKASVSNMSYSGSKLQPKAGLTLLCIKI